MKTLRKFAGAKRLVASLPLFRRVHAVSDLTPEAFVLHVLVFGWRAYRESPQGLPVRDLFGPCVSLLHVPQLDRV